MVICLEQDTTDLHYQLMPLPPHHLLLHYHPAYLVVLENRPLNGCPSVRTCWLRRFDKSNSFSWYWAHYSDGPLFQSLWLEIIGLGLVGKVRLDLGLQLVGSELVGLGLGLGLGIVFLRNSG